MNHHSQPAHRRVRSHAPKGTAMSSLNRDFVADLEIRSDGEGRTIHGIVVPYDVPARVRDGGAPYDEQFQYGAFAKTLSERRSPVKLLSQHDPHNPIGRAVELEERKGLGLYGAFRVSNTRAANDQLELARDGVLDSFSVGFAPVNHIKRGATTVRTEVKLREVSLVTFPAYETALVAGIRSLDPGETALAQQLLAVIVAADTGLDPIVDALCAADGALDAAQAVLAQILAVPNPDPSDLADDGMDAQDATDLGLEMSSSLTSLARRLDEAIVARGATTPHGAGEPEPRLHSGRLIIARNNLRAALIERGLR